MPSPFNCFSSTSHDTLPRHYTPHLSQQQQPRPYSSAALPPLQASTRARRPRASSAAELKGRIGSPMGFRHVAHAGAEGGAREGGQLPPSTGAYLSAALSSPSSRSAPSLDLFDPARRTSLDPGLALCSSPPLAHRGGAHVRQPSFSAPSSPRLPPSASSPPSPSPPLQPQQQQRKARPLSRKPPPAITASVIQQAGGVAAVQQTGGVPSRLVRGGGAPREERGGEEGKGEGMEEGLEGMFSASELRAVKAALAGALPGETQPPGDVTATEPSEQVKKETSDGDSDDDEERPAYESNTARAFRGAMADVEAALRADAAAEDDEERTKATLAGKP